MLDNTVIVIDLSTYKVEHQEPVPFKAIVLNKYDNELEVRSLATNKEYEIYYSQILEGLDIEEILKLINLKG